MVKQHISRLCCFSRTPPTRPATRLSSLSVSRRRSSRACIGLYWMNFIRVLVISASLYKQGAPVTIVSSEGTRSRKKNIVCEYTYASHVPRLSNHAEIAINMANVNSHRGTTIQKRLQPTRLPIRYLTKQISHKTETLQNYRQITMKFRFD